MVALPSLTLCDIPHTLSALLHILKDGRYLADFDLQPGSHLLGISDTADLMLSDDHVTTDVCYVELTGDGQVSLLALPTVDLLTAKDDVVPELVLRNGDYGSAAGLRLLETLAETLVTSMKWSSGQAQGSAEQWLVRMRLRCDE